MTWFNDEQNWPPEWSPDYNHYEIIRFARSEAFGAIRRAVEDARKIDRGVFYETDGNVIDYRKAEAALIRRTIRTIIGSPKA